MNLSPVQFNELAAQGYNRIPLQAEVLADLDTPLSSFVKLACGPYAYLLESVHGGEKWGRYSIIGLPCRTVLTVRGNDIVIEVGGEVRERAYALDPLTWIECFAARYRVPVLAGLPRFTGGLVGYFGYDCVRYVEPRLGPCRAPDPLDSPDIMLLLSDEVVVFDNLSGKLHVIVHVDPSRDNAHARGEQRLQDIVNQLRSATPSYASEQAVLRVGEKDFVSGFAQADFERAVGKVRDYILAGDVMQVVLSQRLSVDYDAPPLQLYRALRCLNPSPYMFFFDMKDFHIVGSSPEILVRVEEQLITVRPIAGTRRRGASEQEDCDNERELLADPKERAEHLMLIDLGRNDIGRVCEPGSVRVTEQMAIERYSHVMHIVSNVVGRLRRDMTAMDALRAAFPAGTVSGAPKIRAMEIIDELEPVKRGIYAGAVGYIGWNGNMDTAIAIRTSVIKDKVLHVQAGAGVVADSDPRAEWEETLSKGRATFRAVTLVGEGLDGVRRVPHGSR